MDQTTPNPHDNEDDQLLGEQLRTHATRYKASTALRASIRTQVALKTAATAPRQETRAASTQVLVWRGTALGLVGGVALTLAMVLLLRPQTGTPLLGPSVESALVSSHVNAIGRGPLFEVASSDRHTVKPWFQGKLDFAPPVPDLSAAGFPLVGGRVDHIDGRTVAALAYMHNRHIVDVYIWPDEVPQPPLPSTRKGFSLNHWSDGGMQIWLVSDADASEVEHFGQTWRAHAIQSAAPAISSVQAN